MERKRPKANQKKESKKEREKERLSLSRSTNAWIQINIIFELTECKLDWEAHKYEHVLHLHP